jgi:hypothetical protein
MQVISYTGTDGIHYTVEVSDQVAATTVTQIAATLATDVLVQSGSIVVTVNNLEGT